MDKDLEELIKEFEKNYPISEQDIEESEKFIEEYEKTHSIKKIEPTLTYEQVGEYINSPKFVELLAQYGNKTSKGLRSTAGKLIGTAMDYADIFRNSGTSSIEEMEEILRGVVKRDVKHEKYDILNVFEKKLLRDLGLHKKEELTTEEDDMVKSKILDILAFKQTKFHAFNGAFLDSIKENGINPTIKTSDAAKDELDELHKKYGFFWKESIKADQGHVSYSATASVSYHYAQTSPEWFNNMCDCHFSDGDYDAARKTFEKTANDANFSQKDKTRYMELFERCWQEFAGNKTYLAVVPDVIAHDYEDLFNVRCKFLDCDSSFAFKVLAGSIRAKSRNVNERTNTKIDTTNASFIELPDLKELQKQVEAERQRKVQSGFEA